MFTIKKYFSSVWVQALCIGFLFFLIQWTQILEYGVTWDEPLHRNWGKLATLFLQTGDRRLLELMPGHGIHYGPLFYIANFLLSEHLLAVTRLPVYAANHVLTLLTSSALLGTIFLLGNRYGGKKMGIAAALAAIFFPLFIAHAHYNPKDIPLALAVSTQSLIFLSALQSRSRSLLIISAMFFGFALATKVSAVLILPAIGVSFLVSEFQHAVSVTREFIVRLFITIGVLILATTFGLVLAWPSTWGDLGLIMDSFVFFSQPDFWPGVVTFFGVDYRGAELPWYYTVLEFAMGAPVLWNVFCCIGAWMALKSVCGRSLGALAPTEVLYLFLWAAVPLLVSMKPGLVRYDGMRQFFFILPALAVFVAYGFLSTEKFLRQRYSRPIVATAFIALIAAWLSSEVWKLHPFEGSYRNEIVRMFLPENMDKKLQIEYWGASYRQGIEWLNENADTNSIVCVPTAGVLVEWYDIRPDIRFDCTKTSNYVMFFTRYSELKAQVFEAMTPVFEVKRMNASLLKIYKVR